MLVHVGRFAVVAALISSCRPACGGGDSGRRRLRRRRRGRRPGDGQAGPGGRVRAAHPVDGPEVPASVVCGQVRQARARQQTAREPAHHGPGGRLRRRHRRARGEGPGVEPCFVTPSCMESTAGKWSDRWDTAFGSGAITADRMTRLWMTAPYRASATRAILARGSTHRRTRSRDSHAVLATSPPWSRAAVIVSPLHARERRPPRSAHNRFRATCGRRRRR
jgi:hypothetical protein